MRETLKYFKHFIFHHSHVAVLNLEIVLDNSVLLKDLLEHVVTA